MLSHARDHPHHVESRSRGGSTTTSPTPTRTATARFTRLSSGRTAKWLRFRSAPTLCTAFAENGIAAHWLYKEGRQHLGRDEQQMAWLRDVLEWQKDLTIHRSSSNTSRWTCTPKTSSSFTAERQTDPSPERGNPTRFCVRDSLPDRHSLRRRQD